MPPRQVMLCGGTKAAAMTPDKRQARVTAAPSGLLQPLASPAASPSNRARAMYRLAVTRDNEDAAPLPAPQLSEANPDSAAVTVSRSATPASELTPARAPQFLATPQAPESDSEEYSEDEIEIVAADAVTLSPSTSSPSVASTSPSTPTPPGRPPLLRRAPLSVAVHEAHTPVLSSASASPKPIIPELVLPSDSQHSTPAKDKQQQFLPRPAFSPLPSLDEQLLRLKEEGTDDEEAPIQKQRRKKKSKRHAMRPPASPSAGSFLQPSLASPSHSAYLAPSPSFPSLTTSPSSPSFPSLSSGFTPSPSHSSMVSRFSFSESRRSLASCSSLPQLGMQPQQQQQTKMKPLSLDATQPTQANAMHLSPPTKLLPQLSRSGSTALLPTLAFSPSHARNLRPF